MQVYLDLVERVLSHGVRKRNRTGVDTLSSFAEHYRVDLAQGFPLLTTKKVNFQAHDLFLFLCPQAFELCQDT